MKYKLQKKFTKHTKKITSFLDYQKQLNCEIETWYVPSRDFWHTVSPLLTTQSEIVQ